MASFFRSKPSPLQLFQEVQLLGGFCAKFTYIGAFHLKTLVMWTPNSLKLATRSTLTWSIKSSTGLDLNSGPRSISFVFLVSISFHYASVRSGKQCFC